ncbi:MAG: DNA-directed DNA polymerase [Nanoarchaeota archaeon]|nr:DNA-directed DNA polymerase [Nanoarchaeota archaeon]
MKFEFVPVDYDYFDFDGRNYVRLIGRNEKGRKVCVVDSYEPNFYVILKKGAKPDKVIKKIKGIEVSKSSRTSKVLRTEVIDKKFLGKDVKAIRVFVTNHKDAHDIASEIGDMDEIEARREYDIPIISKYIKEKGVEPLTWHSVEGNILGIEDFGGIADAFDTLSGHENLQAGVEICVGAKKISKLEKEQEFEPKILAYDIETDDTELGKGDVLMISLYGEGIKKVLTWKNCDKAQDYVECFKDEGEMIEKFVEYVNDYDPDILTGYFSDGFDLPYLKAASQKNKVKLGLGIDGRGPTFTRGRIPSGKINGIVHVDLFRFVDAVFSQYLQSETLSLNEVAGELVGEKKEDFDFARLPNMTNSDWQDFFSYNLQDAIVTYKLAEKLWPDMLEFCKIVKEPLFEVTRDRMSSHVENHILHNLDRFDEIAEKRPMYNEISERKAKGKFEGAFVFEPSPGLYENLVMFDFTSMHASIIVSFNISKSTLSEKGGKGFFESPEFVLDGKKGKFYFEKKEGFFGKLLSEVVEKRKKYKEEYNRDKNAMTKARSNAYKLLANASFGYQGFFGARYYSREAAASTLAFVRKFTHDTINTIEKEGYKIIYSDTDSIAFLQGSKSKKQVLDFLKKINSKLPGIMELDLEDFYSRGLFVSKRTTDRGAKKKYALVDEKGKIKIRGFETVRRDWCKLTRNLQSEVLAKILSPRDDSGEPNDEPYKDALKLLRKVLADLKNRNVNLDDLMIRTQLRQPINEYLNEGPHVVAAKKMEAQEISVSPGMLIEYFIGEGKGKRVGDRVFLPDEKAKYDIEYYLNNQILPAVENIFDVFDVNVREIAEGEKQEKLF